MFSIFTCCNAFLKYIRFPYLKKTVLIIAIRTIIFGNIQVFVTVVTDNTDYLVFILKCNSVVYKVHACAWIARRGKERH